jgi:multidrug efflux pump subunit AcrB
MTLSEISIRRPVFTTMVTLGLLALGYIGYTRLGTDLYPDVSMPFVTIAVPYPGAAPEAVEREILEPIEDAVVAINGVDRVNAFARDNVGFVAVIFKMSRSPSCRAQTSAPRPFSSTPPRRLCLRTRCGG